MPIDPSTDDFFKSVIEERKNPTTPGSAQEVRRNSQFLKTIANSGAYGVSAQVDPKNAPPRKQVRVRVHGMHDPFDALTTKPEVPGPFFFSPFAALVTGGARLMLCMAHACVHEFGGMHAFGDTDSLAVIATEMGGLVPCPGGTERTADGSDAIRVLSWNDVCAIAARFAQLNPYDPARVPGSILEIEKENYEEGGGALRQLYALPISVKRYALFNLEPDGGFRIRKWSEHGLGHLLNPTDPKSDDRDWIKKIWEVMISEALGRSVRRPDWFRRPAISRLTITSPKQLQTLIDDGADVWPFSFMLQAHVAPNGHPARVDPTDFQLIAPYDPNPINWLSRQWIDGHSGRRFRVCTGAEEHAYHPDRVRLQTYGEVYDAYRVHPDPKSLGSDGEVCGPETVGMLQRRPVELLWVKYVGKESNRLEEVQHGAVTDINDVQEFYVDPKYDPWGTAILPILRQIPISDLVAVAHVTERQVRNILRGRSRPRDWRQAKLERLAIDWVNRPTGYSETSSSGVV